ncbi:hypothetical protein BIY22_15435 [Vibrio panuliri]|uniref:Uncharacterized protein n=1 Tax=Vibrio panuliri TaxID=1381081 RepID=A0A1Q9HNQ7_9VIBR|nr:hypothetical protein [Vibrio panuliri]OLQ92443.1 hypothetical protein BIY22_15435 [Vibrio panuliri]
MKKLSLLAASIVIGLTGCGGDGEESGSSSASFTLTAFDGYLSNAIVFIDSNDDSSWSRGETILGLTNQAGQLSLATRPEGVIAVQTLTPNGVVQQRLVSDHPEYEGIYTIDTDRPAQPMQQEVVLKTTASSNVVSPLTDWIVIAMESGQSEQQAIESLTTALGKPVSPFDNYLSGNTTDSELHKLAQILTETKANNDIAQYKQNRDAVVTKAQDLVDTIISDPNLDVDNSHYIPTIEIALDNTLSSKSNHLIVVNQHVAGAVQQTLSSLMINDSFSGVTIPLTKSIDGIDTELFQDADQTGSIVPSLANSAELSAKGLNAVIVAGALEITPNGTSLVSGEYQINLQASDLDSGGNLVTHGQALFPVTIQAASNNQLPIADDKVSQSLQGQITADWSFQVGTPVSNMTLDISNLFNDPEGDKLKFGTRPRLSYHYLERGIDVAYSADFSTLTLSGTPTGTASDGTMSIDVQDHFHGYGEWTTVELKLPDITQ